MEIRRKLALCRLLFQTAVFLGLLMLIGAFTVRTLDRYPTSEWGRTELAIGHLDALRAAFHEQDAARRMQQYFPEGACFALTLYGLAWSNLAAAGERRDETLREIEWALREQEKPYATAPFQATQVPMGVFYLGQNNLLLGKYLSAFKNPSDRPAAAVERFHRQSALLHDAFMASPIRHLHTYPGMCWPADNVTALTSLLVHDQLYATKYRDAYEAWKSFTTAHPDPATSMTPGMVNADTGEPVQPARGCANSWNLAMLAEFDPVYAMSQYQLFKRHFGIRRLGFQMFREYPVGHDQRADVDSGPIIWGAGVVATGVGLAAARANGDDEMVFDIHALANSFGWARRMKVGARQGVQYLFGLLPMGDAFLAWGYSLPCMPHLGYVPEPRVHWPLYWAISAIVTLLLVRGWFIGRGWRRWWKGGRAAPAVSDMIAAEEAP